MKPIVPVFIALLSTCLGGGIRVFTHTHRDSPSAEQPLTNHSPGTSVTFSPDSSIPIGNPVEYSKAFEAGAFIALADQLKKRRSTSVILDNERILLRLNAMLEQADENQLNSLLESNNPRLNQNSAAINLIYRKWADLAPERAAKQWMANSGDKPTLPVDGLLLSWVAQNPAQAKSWVTSINQNHPAKSRALISFAKTLATIDSEQAFLYLTEARAAKSSDRDYIIGKLDRSRMRDYAGQVSNDPGFLDRLVNRWSQFDPVEALDWMIEQELGPEYGKCLETALTNIADQQPLVAAEKLVDRLANDETTQRAASKFWLQWMKSGKQQDAAIEWFIAHGEHLSTSGKWLYIPDSIGGKNQTAEDSLNLLSRLMDAPDSVMKEKIMNAEIKALAAKEPQNALEFMHEYFPVGRDVDIQMGIMISAWAEKGDSEAATRWAAKNMPEGMSFWVTSAIEKWATKDPIAAGYYALELPELQGRTSLAKMAAKWVQHDPKSTIEFIRSADSPDKLNEFTKIAFRELAKNGNENALMNNAGQLPSSQLQDQAVLGLIGGLIKKEPTKAEVYINRLESGPLRDAGIKDYIDSIPRENPQLALPWALKIQSPKGQRSSIKKYARRWLQSDPEAANTWIRNTPGLSAEIKTQIFR